MATRSKAKTKAATRSATRLGPRQLRWVKALESGAHKQGLGSLEREAARGHFLRCCLGVACRVFEDEAGLARTTELAGGRIVALYDGSSSHLPKKMVKFLATRNEAGLAHQLPKGEELAAMIPRSKRCRFGPDGDVDLVDLNDVAHLTFKQIAAVIRNFPGAFFTRAV